MKKFVAFALTFIAGAVYQEMYHQGAFGTPRPVKTPESE